MRIQGVSQFHRLIIRIPIQWPSIGGISNFQTNPNEQNRSDGSEICSLILSTETNAAWFALAIGSFHRHFPGGIRKRHHLVSSYRTHYKHTMCLDNLGYVSKNMSVFKPPLQDPTRTSITANTFTFTGTYESLVKLFFKLWEVKDEVTNREVRFASGYSYV